MSQPHRIYGTQDAGETESCPDDGRFVEKCFPTVRDANNRPAKCFPPSLRRTNAILLTHVTQNINNQLSFAL
jgi:hypothetical protein